ncbi:Arylsulfatase [Planctomycetales bacterium 10988]|nr:Arylsulfatase [Planctomycetales bacterium 10988]
MNRISKVLFALSLSLLCLNLVATTEAKDRPNVIVILVDDMGFSDIGCYGSEIPTPNLDALAKNGVHFTQFYNTGRCSPTRASLLTGHYPHQAGMGHLDGLAVPGHPGYQAKIADSSVTMAEVLQQAGYFTAITGKWHLGFNRGCTPQSRGFSRSLNLARGGIFFSSQGGSKGGARLYLNGEEKPLDDPTFNPPWYGTNLWTEWGLKFIDEALDEEKPFFLYLAHCAPHFPLMAPQEEIDKFRGKYLTGWNRLREQRYQKQLEIGLLEDQWGKSRVPKNTPMWRNVPEEKRDRFDHIMSIYAAMISTMDQSVGTLVEGLKDRNVLNNTLILFLSDNGGNAESGPDGRYEGKNPGGPKSNVFLGQNWATLNNTPFRKFKHYVHEGGIATPLIAHWPQGIAKEQVGQRNHQPSHLIDIMATVVDYTEAAYPTEWNGHAIEPMEGISLRPVLEGSSLDREQPLFFNHEENRAVRQGKWKIVSLRNQPWELYDMEADRTELHDLAEQHPERVEQMAALYDAWAERTHVFPASPELFGKKKPKKKNKKQN